MARSRRFRTRVLRLAVVKLQALDGSSLGEGCGRFQFLDHFSHCCKIIFESALVTGSGKQGIQDSKNQGRYAKEVRFRPPQKAKNETT